MYVLQIITVLFSIALAWLLEHPERKFIDYGASRQQEKDYHMGSFLVRAFFVLGLSYGFPSPLYWFSIILNGFIVWFCFDIFLNIFLDREWDYLGTTAKTDRWWVDHFEEDAGKMKAGLCVFMVVLLNLIYAL